MSITAPEGFIADGISAGIKENGNLDLALIAAKDSAVSSAAVFTSNKVQAAPVLVSKKHLKNSKSRIKAIIINSGCANAATGEEGHKNAELMCEKTAAELTKAEQAEPTEQAEQTEPTEAKEPTKPNISPHQILVCSTGLIGFQLPIQKILTAIPGLTRSLTEGLPQEGGANAAKAIMTTDTQPKEHIEEGDGFLVGGMAKGAAMLAPNMATMLAVITTDAICEKPEKNLSKILQEAVADSFNKLSIDGVQSTNDTVILLASGKAGKKPIADIKKAVSDTCKALAFKMAGDAEGGTKTIKVCVSGAPSNTDADYAARYLADSMLIKCSWNGGDPYWGRVVSELGAAGLDINLEKLSISYGIHKVYEKGNLTNSDIDKDTNNNQAALAEYMSGDHLDVFVDLGLGRGEGYILTCDLGHGYIDENSKTS